jgi:hypothetical protein
MKNKFKLLLTSLILLALLLGMNFVSSTPPAGKFDLKVIKLDNKWKVVDASDYSKYKVKVKKNSSITWTVVGTDAYFQFPDAIFEAETSADSLINGYTKFVKDGKKLKLKVKGDALAGTYEYAVFCTADGVFAIGGSPPKIIIE